MFSIDFNNELNDYLQDEERKIPKAHLNSVCLIYQKEKTCCYVSLSPIGFVCMKNSPIQDKLKELVRDDKLTAKGDNCEGLGEKICDKS